MCIALLKIQMRELPNPSAETGKRVFQSFLRERTPLSALEVMHKDMGDIFRISLPGFNPIVLAGPEANHMVLVTHKNQLHWRVEKDPVTRLLRHGVLVEDGLSHDVIRRSMMPALHKRVLGSYVEKMVKRTDQVINNWVVGEVIDMLIEMRKIALLVIIDSLFGVDFSSNIGRLWGSVLRALDFISPGLWILWPDMPRPGYKKAVRELNNFLYGVIEDRRHSKDNHNNLLSLLISNPEMTDDLIRDQLITILIAGHDTSTAVLSWVLLLLGENPTILRRVRSEIKEQVGYGLPNLENMHQMYYMDQVVSETLRLYPPIHIGNRVAAGDLEFQGYRIPKGTRVMYSIYLTHRDERYWPEPNRFDPDRFSPARRRLHTPYTYVAFGGGSRNCIGLAFAELEVKIILTRLLQLVDFQNINTKIYPHMGATLEPRPGIKMLIRDISKGF